MKSIESGDRYLRAANGDVSGGPCDAGITGSTPRSLANLMCGSEWRVLSCAMWTLQPVHSAKIAVMLTFDFDAESVWIARDPENAERLGVLSQGLYGAKRAVPKLLELLRDEAAGLRGRVLGALLCRGERVRGQHQQQRRQGEEEALHAVGSCP